MKPKRIVLIDGHALIHRAYHALPAMSTKSGELTNAVYGFTMILLKVLKDLAPNYVAVAMDLPGKTFRHDQYPEYKATRKKADDGLIIQFDRVRDVIKTLNIPIYEKIGYEADDVIGSVASKLKKDNNEIFIVTGDLDELQLVDKNVKVYTMRRGFTDTVVYDPESMHEKYGLTPDEFIEYKALRGDPSDNIPGVSGIGEKTAKDLIEKYKNIENIYQNLYEIKPAIVQKLEAGKEKAFLSRTLSRIVTDLPIEIDLAECVTHEFDRVKVSELFRELEFKSLLAKLPTAPINQATLFDEEEEKPKSREHFTARNYKTITIEEDLNELVKTLSQQKLIAIDTETNSLNEIEAKLVGISVCYKEGEAYYIPIAHERGEQLSLKVIQESLGPIFKDKNIFKIGQNIKYDYVVLKNAGIEVTPIMFDTMVGAYLINPNARAQSLNELAFMELGIEMVSISELIGKGKDQITFDKVEIEKASLYAAEDADITLRLYNHISSDLEKQGFGDLMSKIEAPLIPILGDMEINGIKIDEKILNELSTSTGKRLSILEEEIYKVAGEKFNIASPSQLQKILFDKLQLHEKINKKELKKLASGGYSTGADELEKLRDTHEIIEKIFEFRELSKLKNTYLDALPKLINMRTGRIHTSFNQAVVATGRLSSSNPNLQNIPIRGEVGREIRKAFVSENGYSILSADYSQIEMRVIAHISTDEEMIKVFREEKDIHTATAAKVYGVAESKVTKDMRRNAKAVNFGIVYGISPHGLRRQTGMSYEDAQNFINKYFEIHPDIKKYMDEAIEVARSRGYAETLFGRRRYLPDLSSTNFILRGSAERMAINMPIQGSAADLIKLAMIEIYKELPKISPKTRLLLQVHDELVFEALDEDIDRVSLFVHDKMENVLKLDVPILAEVGVGKNWGDTK
jgi:DNA polymerase-1